MQSRNHNKLKTAQRQHTYQQENYSYQYDRRRLSRLDEHGKKTKKQHIFGCGMVCMTI